MAHVFGEQERTSFCTLHFFDCLSTSRQDDAQKRSSVYPSVKRETNVLYQQPHLVEPMKLRVYEDLPTTPIVTEPSHLSQWSKNLASRASSRTSRISARKRTTAKWMISKPQPILEDSNDLPLRRRRDFTPLQLSIYVDTKRLSDLPEFDRFSFTDVGEIKLPQRALLRTQSEALLRKPPNLIIDPPKRTASMFEAGDITFARPETTYSIISTSRPPSEYDALHSHPVSWASLPGIPITKAQKPDNIVVVMTPMQEEFSPVTTAVTVDGTVLRFPKTEELKPSTSPSDTASTPKSQAPYPTVHCGPISAARQSQKPSRSTKQIAGSYQTQKRISQWLSYRANSTSTSTIGSVSTTASFAEHRRKRSEFYQLSQHQPQEFPVNIPKSVAPLQAIPFDFSSPPCPPQHTRTNTESTSHTTTTTETSVLSSTFDHDSSSDSSRQSIGSTTTFSSPDMINSRRGTVKSLPPLTGLRIITPDERDPILPSALSGEIVHVDMDIDPHVYLSEINGPLRSPGVGIAF